MRIIPHQRNIVPFVGGSMIRNTIKQNASPKLSSATSFVRKSLGMKTDEHRGALFGIK